MGRLDNLPDNTQPDDPQAAAELLRSMTHDLRSLQQDLVAQLHQDVQRLQAEKSRLISDIEKLQNQQQLLQSEQEVSLSRQQLAQQQAWAKQLALALANHLQSALMQRVSQTITTQPVQRTVDVPQITATSQSMDTESTYRLLASIDETINHALTSMRHDLSSYQSALSQQISRMHDLGQQGEAILDVLVKRISQQLQAEALKGRGDRPTSPLPPSPTIVNSALPTSAPPPPVAPIPPMSPQFPPAAPTTPESFEYSSPEYSSPEYSSTEYSSTEYASSSANLSVPPTAYLQPDDSFPFSDEELPETMLTDAPPETVSPSARSTSQRRSPFQVGLILILFSTATLALHHVIVQLIGTPGRLFGSGLEMGGFIILDRMSSALLIFWVRMLTIVPLMAWLAGLLYRPVWRDFKAFLISKDRRLLWSLVGSGIFLMVSQVFLYIAIGQLGPAVAVTISSLYSLVTIVLTWMLFGDRPTRLRLVAGVAIFLGVAFTVLTARSGLSDSGMVAGLISAGSFALYLTAMAIINRRKLNPVPISLIQNATMFVLSSLVLIGGKISAPPSNWTGLLVCGVILGGLTIISYILSDVGSRILGAARATLITASVPALTALLAFLILPSAQNSLSPGQILGILIVTLGIAALSFERVLNQHKAAVRQAK